MDIDKRREAVSRTNRRGRLPATERAAREIAVLDAALVELIEKGVGDLSMSGVAVRAGASKETLYTWFGNRDGLLKALIRTNADATVDRVKLALNDPSADPRRVLTDFIEKLLVLLVSPSSIALNRAAMTTPELAATLLEHGRYRVGPLVESYLGHLDANGQLTVPDPPNAFELLYGLAVRDLQIRVLLGEPAPAKRVITRRAAVAVDQFIALVREDQVPRQ